MNGAPTVLHITTTDVSLELLLGPQLRAFKAAGYNVAMASAPGPFTKGLEAAGIVHYPLHNLTRSMNPASDIKAARDLYLSLIHI